jgi:hypothetical protein
MLQFQKIELKEITEEMRNALRKPLPKAALKQHGSKTYLSSINPMYVVERLNDVFGVGAFRTKYTMQHYNEKSGDVVLHGTFEIPEYGVYFEQYGGNNNGGANSKGFDPGDAFKGAATDFLTKVASYLEIGIDIFKGQQNHNTPDKPVAKPQAKAPAQAPAKPSQTQAAPDNSKLIEEYNKLLAKIPEAQQKALKLPADANADKINAGIKYLNNIIKTKESIKTQTVKD